MVKTPTPEGFEIMGIFKKDLSQDDFGLSYLYLNNEGNYVALPDDPAEAAEIYYKSIKAVIAPTASGTERGLYIVNNNGSFEKQLDSLNNAFTFMLSDKYGYTYEVSAEADNFDLLPGTVGHTLSTSEPTNHDITVTINASDAQSGVNTVVLTHNGTLIPLTVNTGIYTAVLNENGDYLIVMTDNAGNKRTRSFSISNIDKTLPAIIEKTYSFPQENGRHTSKDISVSLKFSKPNVRLTKVERSSGSAGSYNVDFNGSTIRFTENMSVTVYFTDEYGNTANELITVKNIYKTPPAVSAEMTVSADKLTSDVTFIRATSQSTGAYIDAFRELSELTVSFGGITQRADKAVYTFNRNGTYTFRVFDDEGVTSYVTVTIDGIDREAPKITQIRWSYEYDLEENGEWKINQKASGSYNTGNEAGYVIGSDTNPVTNRNVSVVVVSDSKTATVGDDGEYTAEHEIKYDENGMYIFNLKKENGLTASYGVDVEIIDKTPPVIELVLPKLIFFENEKANEKPYSRDMIDKGFKAYDMFGGYRELTSSVVINYGGFDPSDLSNNVFDRSKPYIITYTVCDEAHNETTVRMTVRLVSMFDSIVLVNGAFPDYAGRSEIYTDTIELKLMNFSGISYATVCRGVKTFGEMKTKGEVITPDSDNSYVYKAGGNGWYTFFIQTDKRDYFIIQTYVNID